MPETLKSMFPPSVAKSNLSTLSRLLKWQSSCTVCCFSSPSGFPDLSWFRTCCSSSVAGFPGLSEELSSSCKTLTISWVTGFPVRSSMGLTDWVGLEEPNWTDSPSDCWTSFPTGRCSTVNPVLVLYSNWDRASKISSVVDEETNIAFHTIFLRFSIFQLSQCNLLEVPLKGWLRSILSDRTSILLW